ncbi:MAG: double-strand break repair helicase AddA [Devosia sp.]
MSRRLLSPMPQRIVDSQRDASNPAHSVWVTANAGSGKTYVLTARVLRLLLSGVRPEEILCLTYTKAAAAEMRGRVSERLAGWVLADNAALVADIAQLTGAPPTAGMLLRARALFAHALDTPGGLKIQTIHAFCESVLHRFPQEAGVPFDFSVIEDFERDGMLLEARERVLATGLRGGPNADAVATLFDLMSDFLIETAINEALAKPQILRRVLADPERTKRNLRRIVAGVGSIAEVTDEVVAGYGLSASDHDRIFELIHPDPKGDDFADRLSRIDPRHPHVDALFEAFLTLSFTARKTLIKKQTAILIPDVAERLAHEADRLERLYRRLAAARLLERSDAMLDIVGAISAQYETAKRRRSLLDFDDLVERLGALLADDDRGLWVRYKLDSGITHILVDEGQDTNPHQWDVVKALINEFFVGDSAVDRPRTLFVVGDQKQSIFSFQGADPTNFVDLGRQIVFTARSVEIAFSQIRLQHSFRTLANVLDAVDLVFRDEELQGAALEDDPLLHQTARAESGGLVALWPPIQEIEDEASGDEWPTEAPLQTKSAQRRVAERIAREIKGWIEAKRPLGPRGRAVTADDVLILVQVRSILFHEIIRALIRENIPTPGADRLAVVGHIGTQDLMALGDVLSNSAEDLQLAALLRSPLFEVSEDELREVAQPRPDKATLWSALKVSTIPSVKAAYETLRRWRSRLDFERPFNFYSTVLYAESGLKKLRARLGGEIDDVVAEFLDLALAHEQSEQPSLTGFLAELRAREVTIKRELAEAGAGVRVMTVHGAKGLEAPIVMLADAATTEVGRDRRAIYMQPEPPLFFHASSKDTHADETIAHKDLADAAQKAEYWRKLYVGMTRAEDELYVTGYLTKRGKLDGSWYDAVERGLRPHCEIVLDAEGNEAALVYPRERGSDFVLAQNVIPIAAANALTLPVLPRYQLRRIVRPSRAADDADPALVLETHAEAVRRDPETARLEGIALHALLQHLVRIEATERETVALKALGSLLPEAATDHQRIARQALSILSRPELSHLFGPDSRGEVPMLAQGLRNGHPVTVAGRIDRLVVTPRLVTIVDYKSDAEAPKEPDGVPAAYLSQMGLYALVAQQLFPGLPVEAHILWTSLESLMKLPAERLRVAVAGFTIG